MIANVTSIEKENFHLNWNRFLLFRLVSLLQLFEVQLLDVINLIHILSNLWIGLKMHYIAATTQSYRVGKTSTFESLPGLLTIKLSSFMYNVFIWSFNQSNHSYSSSYTFSSSIGPSAATVDQNIVRNWEMSKCQRTQLNKSSLSSRIPAEPSLPNSSTQLWSYRPDESQFQVPWCLFHFYGCTVLSESADSLLSICRGMHTWLSSLLLLISNINASIRIGEKNVHFVFLKIIILFCQSEISCLWLIMWVVMPKLFKHTPHILYISKIDLAVISMQNKRLNPKK
jgi:hypothetical protein